VTSDLFAPPGAPWQRVSPDLTKVRRILAIPPLVLVAVVTGSLAATRIGPGWLTALFLVVAVAALSGAAWTWRWAPRNTASWGYAEDQEDLLVTGGVMFRRLVAVPYGRMQFVDVQAGPIDRAFGIASVTLHTASTETAARIPGLPADEATRLRNRLTELGESHGAGL
jgi:membrane protein YdbS with pleckstrin-like domain